MPLGAHATFLAVVLATVAPSPLHLPLNNPNEGVRVFAVKALVEHGTLALDEVVREWGYIDDKARSEGKLYSSKAPLMSLLGAAAYAAVHPFTGDLERAALTRLCRLAGDLVPSLAVAWLLWRGLRRRVRDPVLADLVTVGTVLGSGVLASLHVFSGHALAALAPAAALLLVLERAARGVRAPRWLLVVAGLLLAAAVGAEYPALLACLPIVALALVVGARRGLTSALSDGAWLALGALPVVVAVSAAHTAMFGAPWRTGYSFLENQGYREVVAGTFFGIGAPHPEVLATVLVSPELGLFFMSPFLAIGLWFALRGLVVREHRIWAVPVVVATACMLLFIAGFRGWRGGWSVGPRYISELVGLLAIPTALALDRMASTQVARALLAALAALGLLHAGIAGLFFPHLSDVYRNPVYEMMLPFVARGVSPDSVFLLAGFGPRASTWLLLAVLASPLVVALVWGRELRPALVALAASAGAVTLALAVGPHLAATSPARAALENRRLLDNWRPEAGVPLLVERGLDDPRVLVAVDRARRAWPLAVARGCAPVGEGRVSGRLFDVAAAAPPGALVVVPDSFAFDIYDAAAAAPFFVTRSDVERQKRSPLPCSAWAIVGRHGEPLPGPLRRFAVSESRPLPPVDGEAGFELQLLATPEAP